MSFLFRHRFLVLRRLCQVGILALFWLGAHHHVGILTGDLSSSRVLRTVPLSDPYAVLQILATGRVPEATALLGALFVVLFYLVVGGRSFCGWVCPINPVTDGAGWLRRRLGVHGQLRVPHHARYWIAALGLVLSAILGVAAFEWVSPIGMVHRELIFSAGFGLLAIAWIAVLDVFVLRHGWCGSLCPLGAFYGLLGHFAWLRVGFDASRCDHCGDCVRVCSEARVLRFDEMAQRGFVDDGSCLNCGRCLEVCPRDALSFTSRFTRGIDRSVETSTGRLTLQPVDRPANPS